MASKFQQHLCITADGRSTLKSDRNSSGLVIAPAASGKTTSVVLPAPAALTANSNAAQELLSIMKAATRVDDSEVNNGRRNPFFRMSPRQEAHTGVSSPVEILRRKRK